MASKKKNKPESYADLSVKELQVRLSEAQESHFRLDFRHASHPLKNPMQIRTTRREIARIKTWLRSKERAAV